MSAGKLAFSQVMAYLLPYTPYRRCVARYQGERYVKRFCYLKQHSVHLLPDTQALRPLANYAGSSQRSEISACTVSFGFAPESSGQRSFCKKRTR